MANKKKKKHVKVRNAFALHATSRKSAGPMKDKKDKRQNGKNKQRELQEEE